MANRRSSKGTGGPPVLALIALGAFVILDVALVAVALSATGISTSRVPETLPTLSTATPTQAPTMAPPAPALASRFLVAVSPTSAWRSTAGDCTGNGAIVESTVDAGATWTAESTASMAIKQVLSLSAVSEAEATIVGKAGGNCSVGVFSTFTAGQFWQAYPDSLGAQTYVDAADPATVVTPSGSLPVPCSALLQQQLWNSQPILLCSDGIYQVTGSTGQWLKAAVPGVVAIVSSDSALLIATAGSDGCEGLSIASLPLPLTQELPGAVGCAAGVDASAPVAMAQVGTAVWLWSGDTVRVSADGGATW